MRSLFLLMLSMAIGFACITAPVGECAGSPFKVEKISVIKSTPIVSVADFKFEASYNSEVEKESPPQGNYPTVDKFDKISETTNFNYDVLKPAYSLMLYNHYNSKNLNCKVSKRYISPRYHNKRC